MFYYFDRQNFRIVEATADEIIHTFSEETTSPRGIEPKFFYEDGSLWYWTARGERHHFKGCTKEEAEQQLLSWAIADASNCEYSTSIYPSKQEVLDDLKNELEDEGRWDLEDAWDVEIRAKLNQVLEENK